MKAFTLIELLIVVAIIAILAAIAVPNFLESQVRAKVARCKADLRTLSVGLESYCVDNSRYPDVPPLPVKAGPDWSNAALARLTTPISYLSASLLPDPFAVGTGFQLYGYVNWKAALEPLSPGGPSTLDLIFPGATPQQRVMLQMHQWMLASMGPDRSIHGAVAGGTQSLVVGLTTRSELSLFYDPTNGSVSNGDIVRTIKGQLN